MHGCGGMAGELVRSRHCAVSTRVCRIQSPAAASEWANARQRRTPTVHVHRQQLQDKTAGEVQHHAHEEKGSALWWGRRTARSEHASEEPPTVQLSGSLLTWERDRSELRSAGHQASEPSNGCHNFAGQAATVKLWAPSPAILTEFEVGERHVLLVVLVQHRLPAPRQLVGTELPSCSRAVVPLLLRSRGRA